MCLRINTSDTTLNFCGYFCFAKITLNICREESGIVFKPRVPVLNDPRTRPGVGDPDSTGMNCPLLYAVSNASFKKIRLTSG